MVNRTHTWLASGLSRAGAQDLDPNEIIDIHFVPVRDLEEGRQVDFEVNAIMLVTWYWFQRWRNQHVADWEACIR